MGLSVENKYKFNQRITAATVRLVGEGLNQVLSLPEALKKSQEQGLDLVEVGPRASPPVVRIVDLKKFIYQESKKERKRSRGAKSKLKEIRLTPNIAENDFNNKIKRGQEFLTKGDQLRVNVLLRGRLAAKPELAWKKMEAALKALTEDGRLLAPPKWQGKYLLLATLTPK